MQLFNHFHTINCFIFPQLNRDIAHTHTHKSLSPYEMAEKRNAKFSENDLPENEWSISLQLQGLYEGGWMKGLICRPPKCSIFRVKIPSEGCTCSPKPFHEISRDIFILISLSKMNQNYVSVAFFIIEVKMLTSSRPERPPPLSGLKLLC